jgi:glutamate/tyrosine decarboxylase-like PLP-dependent enzyme
MTSSPPEPATPAADAGVWGDESAGVEAVLAWAARRIAGPSEPLNAARPASELEALMGNPITPEGIGADRALHLFTDVVVPATRATDDPMNLAYVPSAPTRSAAAFELATSASNIFAGLWEGGAGAIHAENQVIAWLARQLAWPDTSGGCFVSGGTVGNLSALVAARHAAEDVRESAGLSRVPEGGWLVACTDDAYSSVKSAARVMGVGVLRVPGDDRGRLTGAALADALEDAGDRVCAVVATAGTTNAGIVDDLAGVSEACRAGDVWLHVDGAYGGAAIVAPSVAGLFAGIEHADSFIVDPHKWLFAPYDACALVYRRPELAKAAHQQTASYLDQIDRAEWNPADLAVHLSRRPRGLSLWFSLATHGTDRYRTAVERCLAIAGTVADDIRRRPGLRLVVEPELTVLLFERLGWAAEDYAAWSREQARTGRVLCVPTRWQGEPVLRLVFVNPSTDPALVSAVLDTLTPE